MPFLSPAMGLSLSQGPCLGTAVKGTAPVERLIAGVEPVPARGQVSLPALAKHALTGMTGAR
jgi:hypothetical protein